MKCNRIKDKNLLTFRITFVFPVFSAFCLPKKQWLLAGFQECTPFVLSVWYRCCFLGGSIILLERAISQAFTLSFYLGHVITLHASGFIICDSCWRCLLMITVGGWVKRLLNCLKALIYGVLKLNIINFLWTVFTVSCLRWTTSEQYITCLLPSLFSLSWARLL